MVGYLVGWLAGWLVTWLVDWLACWPVGWQPFSSMVRSSDLLVLVPQDSLRYLVQDSLAAFTRMITDACHSVIDLPDDFAWGNDIVTSPYK